jgi:hypothetical protein
MPLRPVEALPREQRPATAAPHNVLKRKSSLFRFRTRAVVDKAHAGPNRKASETRSACAVALRSLLDGRHTFAGEQDE